MKNELSAVAVAVVCGIYCGHVSAQIYELAFVDTTNSTVVKSPSISWYNPTGTITVTHIAGLDRTVKLELLKSGVVVSTQTSALLTVANRITASDGQTFYGVKFTLPAQAEGNYVLRSTVYDISGAQVSSNSYTFNVDVTPPTASATKNSASGYGQVTTGSPWMFGTSGSDAPKIYIDGVDDPSGIASASFEVYRGDGSLYKTWAMTYEGGSKTISANLKSVFPTSNLNENFSLQFTVKDGAGNVLKTPMQVAQWDNVCNQPTQPFGVFDPDSANVLGPGLTGFEAYAAGMTVKTNPITLAYRIEKTNWSAYAQSGLSIANGYSAVTKTGEDDQYVYVKLSVPYGNFDQNYLRWVTFGGWNCAGFAYSLTLGSSAPKTPVISGVSYLYSDIGWGSWSRDVQNTSLPVSISKIRVTTPVQIYDQVFSHTQGSCTIPAGETSCEYNVSLNLNTGTTGYLHDGTTLRNAANTLRANGAWADVAWNDLHYPTITYDYDQSTKLLKLYIVQPGRGAYFDRLKLAGAWLENNGTKITLTGGQIAENGTNYTFQFDLKTLPEGQYNLVAVAQEHFGPKTKLNLFAITSDRTAPAIAFSYSGSAVPASIGKITDLRAILTDTVDTAPVVTSMTLSGGPLNDALQLGFSKQADGWAPEVPRMFPSLETGQEYTLTVAVTDAQGNKASKQIKFSLTPSNLVTLAGQTTFAVAQNLQDAAGKPLAVVAFKGALTDGQSQSRGNQSGYITLRSDSNFAVIFNGLTVNPGETKDVVIPLDSTGQVSLPIYPAATGVQGKASYMIDIPQLTVN